MSEDTMPVIVEVQLRQQLAALKKENKELETICGHGRDNIRAKSDEITALKSENYKLGTLNLGIQGVPFREVREELDVPL